MPYDISKWKTKKLDNLVIPLDALYRSERKDWLPGAPKVMDAESGEVEIECGCGQSIQGILKDSALRVTSLDMSGEGSGTFLREILEPALKESTGGLEAVLIWEGGDSVTRLIVKDGVVANSPEDL